MPSFKSSTLRGAGDFVPDNACPNNSRWISSELNRPARRTTILVPSSSHSRIEPGPIPSFRRMSRGTEICPCAVSRDCAIAMVLYYPGNGTKRGISWQDPNWPSEADLSGPSISMSLAETRPLYFPAAPILAPHATSSVISQNGTSGPECRMTPNALQIRLLEPSRKFLLSAK
jgi:hypothetical protein